MRSTIVLACAVMLIALAVPAAAQVRYVDRDGNAHWVQSTDQVPPEYQGQASSPNLPSVNLGPGEPPATGRKNADDGTKKTETARGNRKTPPPLDFLQLYPRCDYTRVEKYDRKDGYEWGVDCRTADTRQAVYEHFQRQMAPNGWQMDTFDRTFTELRARRGPIDIWVGLEDAKVKGYATTVRLSYGVKTNVREGDVPKPSPRTRVVLARALSLPALPEFGNAVFTRGSYESEETAQWIQRSYYYSFKTTSPVDDVYRFYAARLRDAGWALRDFKEPVGTNWRNAQLSAIVNGGPVGPHQPGRAVNINISRGTDSRYPTEFQVHYQAGANPAREWAVYKTPEP